METQETNNIEIDEKPKTTFRSRVPRPRKVRIVEYVMRSTSLILTIQKSTASIPPQESNSSDSDEIVSELVDVEVSKDEVCTHFNKGIYLFIKCL